MSLEPALAHLTADLADASDQESLTLLFHVIDHVAERADRLRPAVAARLAYEPHPISLWQANEAIELIEYLESKLR